MLSYSSAGSGGAGGLDSPLKFFEPPCMKIVPTPLLLYGNAFWGGLGVILAGGPAHCRYATVFNTKNFKIDCNRTLYNTKDSKATARAARHRVMIVQRSFNKLQACKPEKRVNNENLLIKETHTYSAGIFDPSSTLMNQNDAI